MTQLTTIFSQVHNLEKVSLNYTYNLHLEEVELIKNNEYYICLSLHHIVLLKKIG